VRARWQPCGFRSRDKQQPPGQQRRLQAELLRKATRLWERRVRHIAGPGLWHWPLAGGTLLASGAFCRVLALPVQHPEYEGQRLRWWWCEKRKGREPWYLITNEPVESAEQAWDSVWSYARRRIIEECFRFQKTELQIESLRGTSEPTGVSGRRNFPGIDTASHSVGSGIPILRSSPACGPTALSLTSPGLPAPYVGGPRSGT
jgi:hypothetical protein